MMMVVVMVMMLLVFVVDIRYLVCLLTPHLFSLFAIRYSLWKTDLDSLRGAIHKCFSFD